MTARPEDEGGSPADAPGEPGTEPGSESGASAVAAALSDPSGSDPPATDPPATDPSGSDPPATDLPGPDLPGPDLPATPGIFSLEGRRVPGLYLVAWLLTLIGGGAVFVAVGAAGSGSGAARWLFLIGLAGLALGLMAGTGSQAVERARRLDLAYRGPSPVLAFLTVVVITLLSTVVILGPLSAFGLDASSPVAMTFSLVITALAYLFVIRAFVVPQGALSWRDMGLGQPVGTALRELALGMLLAVPVLVITIALSLVLSVFLAPPPSPLPPAIDAAGLLLNLLAAAVLAPLGEELFFRGFTTTAWARAYGVRPAIVRGAVFFAVAHVVTLLDASFAEGLQRAVFSFVALLPVALTLGWVFTARRSLWAPIGLHAAFNGLQVLLAFLAVSAVQ